MAWAAGTAREFLNDTEFALEDSLVADDPGLFAEISTVGYKRRVLLPGTVKRRRNAGPTDRRPGRKRSRVRWICCALPGKVA